MAPTEFLAIQHFRRIMGWLDILEDHERPRVALLTGSIPTAKARIIRNVRFSLLAVFTSSCENIILCPKWKETRVGRS